MAGWGRGQMRRRGRCTAGAVVVLCGLVHAGPAAQEPIDHAMIAAITAEGLERSEAATLFYTLTDVLGPRLTGSPAYIEAAHWARDRFRNWGSRPRASRRSSSAADGRSNTSRSR